MSWLGSPLSIPLDFYFFSILLDTYLIEILFNIYNEFSHILSNFQILFLWDCDFVGCFCLVTWCTVV